MSSYKQQPKAQRSEEKVYGWLDHSSGGMTASAKGSALETYAARVTIYESAEYV